MNPSPQQNASLICCSPRPQCVELVVLRYEKAAD
jgi:hypothetical protein